jgi:hypothetical protein
MNKQRLLGCLLILIARSVPAGDTPHWSFEVKGGNFHSAEEQWADFYGDDQFRAYALAAGYKLTRQLEIGIETGYQADDGKGLAPSHGVLAGNVHYKLYPVHLQLTARGVFTPDQWLVPYVGAAWSRFSYSVETEQQSDTSGSVDGYQYRGGLQLLLDNMEPSTARNLESNTGIVNTYFFLEAQRTEAIVNDIDLGGTAYLAGLLFEF